MNASTRSTLAALFVVLVAHTVAQDSAPLVRQPNNVVVRRRPAATPTPAPETAPRTEQAPMDPRLVVVALVNGHRLSKADLNFLVDRRMAYLGPGILTPDEHVTVLVLDRQLRPDNSLIRDPELAEGIRRDQEAQRRQIEGIVAQEWVEQRVLADEARRQGIVLDPRELEERRRSARAATGMSDEELDAFLARFGMTRADLDREVAETLLIEKLLQKFVAINYTEQDLRAIYETAPEEFVAPTRVRLAHYVLALTGKETRGELADLRDRAERVRRKLQREPDPAKALAGEHNLDRGFLADPDAGWFRLDSEALAPAVAAAAARLKAGETSTVIEDFEAAGGGGRPQLRSYQVIKVLERQEAGTRDFAVARPLVINRIAQECREELVQMLMEGGTHRVITNLRMIPPSKIPTADEVIRMQAQGKPANLRRPG